MIICPNSDQSAPVFNVESPVTQVAEVAVKSASRYPTELPSAEANGSTSKTLPTNITDKYPSARNCHTESFILNFLFIRV